MTQNEIHTLVEKQRSYFYSNRTLDVNSRINALKKLKTCIQNHENEIARALAADLGKSNFESYMCETGLVLSEISYMLKHIRSFSHEKRVHTPLAQFHSRSFTKPGPYGVVLIMSPWNYPFLLSLDPLVDALAAGNTVILKPSAYSPNTSAVISELIKECFSSEAVAVVTGGRTENTSLLNEHFDYIFFTGSQAVGKEVMKKASEHLTPLTLELGGKSPCIIDTSADLKLAARRVVFGKYLNCGQTCVAPDYLLVDERVADRLIAEIQCAVERQLGSDPLSNPEYGKIVNRKHFDRVCGLIDPAKVVLGGQVDEGALKIAPTIMRGVTADDAVMREEIFGPVLPALTFRELDEAIDFVRSRPTPLACYFFSENRAAQRRVTAEIPFGGGCVNDCIMHLATSHMGFGGMGASGMGSYHGRKSFETFTHEKSVISKATFFDAPFRYAPHADWKRPIIKLFVH